MNLTRPQALVLQNLAAHAYTPYSRPIRICVRGQREYLWAWMQGGGGVPVVLESEEEVDRMMRERKAVEV